MPHPIEPVPLMKSIARCLGLVVLLATPGLAQAQGNPPALKPLKLKVISTVARARSQAPQTVDIRVSCNSPKLFTGRLLLKWYLNKRLVHDYVSPELTVTEGGHQFRVLVPQVVARAEKTPITIAGQFVMDNEVIELEEERGPTFPPMWKRSFLVAVVQPPELLIRHAERDAARQQGIVFERGLAESLSIEQFNPIGTTVPQSQLDSSLDMLTFPARLTPEDMPVTAAGYASYDLLLLEGPGFEQLKPKQLAAMGHWVAAGGSLVVRPDGKLTSDHADFLNRLAGFPTKPDGAAAARPGYTLNERGRLVIGEAARVRDSKYARHITGLGRSLIIHEALQAPDDFSTPEWKAVVAFLWKVREGQLDLLSKSGFWELRTPTASLSDPESINRPYAPVNDDLPRSLRQFLLPERIEGVPLAVVAVILGLYLLSIAPGDYFLLGRLGSRKYTWGLFIVVSAAFTWCAVLVAQSYMGKADYHTSLVFADLAEWGGSEGQPAIVRTNRFDMLFVAKQEMVEIPLRNTLYTDLTDRALQSEQRARKHERGPFFGTDNEEMDVMDAPVIDMPVYSGVMPSAYNVQQLMRQWSPRINRRTMLHGDGDLLAATRIDWSRLRPDDWHTVAGRRALRDVVLAQEPQARILLFHEDQIYDPTNEPVAASGSASTGAAQPLADRSELAALVQETSVRAATGFFSVVSQVAPTGGEYLEDLSLLDASDRRQWLLAIAVRRENEWIVFRKLFRRDY
jgi:hypothetical protein